MIPLSGNQRSSSMDYKRWRSSINGILGSRDHWIKFSEDLEPKGGILSRRWERTEAIRGIGGIVLRKSGDLGRRGGSNKMVAG